MPILDDIVTLLNGQLYSDSEAGGNEVDESRYVVPIRTTTPGADSAVLFIEDINDLTSTEQALHMFTEREASTFMTDQWVYLREYCHIDATVMSNAALAEICVMRLLAYRMRLTNALITKATYYIRYNNSRSSDPTVAGSLTHQLQAHANRNVHRDTLRDWLNANADALRRITAGMSNIICTIAYVFRQKGHHFISGTDYADAYTKIWDKVAKGAPAFSASWEQISTIGLHSIPPCVLDVYWRYMVGKGRLAATLCIRLGVPAAGTAAVFALLVGWHDARSGYGLLLQEHEEVADEL